MPELREAIVKHITCFLMFLALVSVAPAQVITGTLVGNVTDPSGAALVGARIVVTNTETNIVTRSVTVASGEYEVPYLQPGEYEIAIEFAGFKKVSPDRPYLGYGHQSPG